MIPHTNEHRIRIRDHFSSRRTVPTRLLKIGNSNNKAIAAFNIVEFDEQRCHLCTSQESDFLTAGDFIFRGDFFEHVRDGEELLLERFNSSLRLVGSWDTNMNHETVAACDRE
jgi:hypothetical protein